MAYAGIGLRLVATVIDAVVLFVLIWIVGMATGNQTSDGVSIQGPTAVVPLAIWFLYYVAMEATTGATLGKMAVGLRVVNEDGSAPIGWGASLVRNVLRIVDGFFVYVVGAILVMTSAKKQRLGDRVAHTIVVKKGVAAAPAAV